ncbi:MAG: hypothetical protein MJ246_02050 [Clostridia bacterium]|nr:hypothetical protein [Clostridia bacterium]
MEFSKLKKGISKFNKKGIKVTAFSVMLLAMALSITLLNGNEKVEASSG